MNKNNYIAIMAGGVGSRFWPASREEMPKQFLDILGVGKSLIRLTFERFQKIVPTENILVVTNKAYKELVAQHIPEIPESNILTEPSRNNTGPCVAYTALRLEAMNPEANFVIAPSDHVILKEDAFLNNIELALDKAASSHHIITLGILPTRPDTGYGYIKAQKEDSNFHKVESFMEKPDLETAKKYLASGDYLWNAGIFVWSVKTILQSFEENAPDIYNILTKDRSKFNQAEEQAYIDEVYPQTPKISVDYAILEKSNNILTLPADIGWSDLGTWNALHAYLEKDNNEIVVQGENTLVVNSKNCMIRSDSSKLVVIKDLSNYIVIDEPDVLLIYPKDQEQEIKALRKDIQDKKYL